MFYSSALMSRRNRLYIYLFALLVIPTSVFLFNYFQLLSTDSSAKSDSPIEHLLVIHRQRERMSPADQQIPFRNSPIALYKRQGSDFALVADGLVCRSTSTASDIPTSVTVHRPSEKLEWGYCDVPAGLYTLHFMPWRDTGHTALQISDYKQNGGLIRLSHIQQIRAAEVEHGEIEGTWKVRMLPGIVREGYNKRDTYIHPTLTKEWSFADSFGCINLYHPDEKAAISGASDWEIFTKWLQDAKVQDSNCAFALWITDTSMFTMTPILKESTLPR